jgi:protein-disulfide isomerase
MTTKPRETKRAARERLAEERRRQAEADRRRQRTIRIAAAVAGVLVIVLVVVLIQVNRDTLNTNAALSPSVDRNSGYGIVVGPASGVPVVDLYEDFQCPACKAFESTGGKQAIEQIEADGKARVVYHVLSFLDVNLKNDSSKRAANASACADDNGKFVPYHDEIFANQPTKEGAGYTDAKLIEFGKNIGITSNSFASCVKDQKYKDWVALSARNGRDKGINQTPTIRVDGKNVAHTAEAVVAAVDAASKK